jgi:hypothetical protein
MHCRIGCRQVGSFIECIDDQVSITINGRDPQNRARLSNEDRIKIGAVEIKVVIPQAEVSSNLFDIAFDDHDTVTARDAPNESIKPLDEPIPQGLENDQAAGPAIERADEDADFPNLSSQRSAVPDRETLAEETVSDDPPATEPSGNQQQSPTESESSNSARPAGSESDDDKAGPKPVKPGRPVFEFDSVEPNDISLTEEDLDVIENMTGNSLVLQDYDVMLDETFPDRDRKQGIENADDFAASLSDVSPAGENQIAGGSGSGKCWRWGGKSALAAIQAVQLSRPNLNCFCVAEHTRLLPTSYEAIKIALSNRNEPQIFVVTEHHSNDLLQYFLTNRWNERLGHPQVLSTFLTVLPSRHIDSLFGEIDACILVQESDVEVVRLNRDLPGGG